MSAAAKKPLMERVGARYFAARSSKLRVVSPAGDSLHVLNAEERKALKRVEYGAIARAALSGAISAGACAAVEVYAESAWSADPVRYWAAMIAATIVTAVLEIAYIYWETLRSVHELARVAGLELFGTDRASSDEALVDSLARAALELPNPVDIGVRVNPHREVKKWRLVLASLAYKAKVGVTNFVMKLLIRRVLSRVALRGLLPFVAVPVTAAWNGVVMWMVLREARIRAMGPSAVDELVTHIFDDAPKLSDAGRVAALRAVAAAIVRTQDLHPNLVRLLQSVGKRTGDVGNVELDDVGQFLEGLKSLDPAELKLTQQVLAVACVVDGKLTAREKKLWADARAAAGQSVTYEALQRLLSAFVAGDGVADDVLRAL